MRTQVGIVGAGPAGLMLSRLLHLAGIECIVLEDRSRTYFEDRMRAGLIEQWARDLLIDIGVGERLQARGHHPRRHQFPLRRPAAPLRLPHARRQGGDHLRPAGGREGSDRHAARRRRRDPLRGRRRERPRFRRQEAEDPFRHDGKTHELECDFIAGCDGFHGICRPSIPDGRAHALRTRLSVRLARHPRRSRRRPTTS